MPSQFLRLRFLFVVGLLVIPLTPAVSGTSTAGKAARSAGRHPTRAVATVRPALPPGFAGMTVGLDPQTGRVGLPAPGQAPRLSAEELQMVSRSQAGLLEHRLPGGGVYIDLDGRFQDLIFVRIGPDGRPTYQCVEDSAAARGALLGKTPLSGGLEVR
jgi:hypothetical protein